MTDAASSRSRRSAGTQSASRRTSIERTRDFREKRREIQRIANELLEEGVDAGTFKVKIFGVGGALSRLFSTPELMKAFEATIEHVELNRIVAELRNQDAAVRQAIDEPTRVITVRLPRSIHEALRDEAIARKISMNKLCISKLLQELEEQESEEDEQEGGREGKRR